MKLVAQGLIAMGLLCFAFGVGTGVTYFHPPNPVRESPTTRQAAGVDSDADAEPFVRGIR